MSITRGSPLGHLEILGTEKKTFWGLWEDKVRKEWEIDTLNQVVKNCPAVGSLGLNSGSHTSSVILPCS